MWWQWLKSLHQIFGWVSTHSRWAYKPLSGRHQEEKDKHYYRSFPCLLNCTLVGPSGLSTHSLGTCLDFDSFRWFCWIQWDLSATLTAVGVAKITSNSPVHFPPSCWAIYFSTQTQSTGCISGSSGGYPSWYGSWSSLTVSKMLGRTACKILRSSGSVTLSRYSNI